MESLDLLVYHSEQGMHSKQNQIIAEFHKQNPEAPECISAAAYAVLPFQLIKNFLLNERYLIGHQEEPPI